MPAGHIGLLQAKDDGVFRLELDPDDPAHVRAALAGTGGDVDAWSRRRAILENGYVGADPEELVERAV